MNLSGNYPALRSAAGPLFPAHRLRHSFGSPRSCAASGATRRQQQRHCRCDRLTQRRGSANGDDSSMPMATLATLLATTFVRNLTGTAVIPDCCQWRRRRPLTRQSSVLHREVRVEPRPHLGLCIIYRFPSARRFSASPSGFGTRFGTLQFAAPRCPSPRKSQESNSIVQSSLLASLIPSLSSFPPHSFFFVSKKIMNA